MSSLKFNSLDQLEPEYQVCLSKFSPELVFKNITKWGFFEMAKTSFQNKDYETCFINVMKFLSVIAFLDDKFQIDKKRKLRQIYGKNFEEAIEIAECVKKKLNHLYEDKHSSLVAAEPQVDQIDQKVRDIISCAQLFSTIKDTGGDKYLLIDCRTESDFEESHIGCGPFVVNIINVPDPIIVNGRSAQNIEEQLPAASHDKWSKRGSYHMIIILDWGTPVGKSAILRNILLVYDRVECKNVVILENGFSAWAEWYPWTLSKPCTKNLNQPLVPSFNLAQVNFDLDFGVDNVSVKPFFDRSKKPKSTVATAPVFDRSSKAAALKKYELAELMKQKDEELKEMLEAERLRLRWEIELKEEQRRRKEAIYDEERHAILIDEEERLLNEINNLKISSEFKDDKIRQLEACIEDLKRDKGQKTAEELDIEKNISKHEEETRLVKKECDNLEVDRLKQEARSKPKPSFNQSQRLPQRPEINRSNKPKAAQVPVIGKSPGLMGLKNLGNTCYMNSILQCVSNSPILASFFMRNKPEYYINKNSKTRGQVAEKLAEVVRVLWSGQYQSFACLDFKNVVGAIKSEYKTCEQQDSHEFLTFLMDWLHNDLKNESMPADGKSVQNEMEKAWENFIKNDSLISTSFYGLQKSTVSCSRCNEQSSTYEPFSNLSLTIPEGEGLELSMCLELYLRKENISGWRCPKCNDQRQAEKKTEFCRLPKMLVIHLKRFSFLDVHSKKKTTYVDFPLHNLTLKSNQGHTNYSLYGVSNHYGTMEGGHYTAYCENPIFEKWFKFDDHEVTQMNHRDVVTSAAYILFYKSVS